MRGWPVVGEGAEGESFALARQEGRFGALPAPLAVWSRSVAIRGPCARQGARQPRSWACAHPSPVAASLPLGGAVEGSRSLRLSMTHGEPGAQTGPSREIPGSADVQPRAVAHRESGIRRIRRKASGCRFTRIPEHPLAPDLASGSDPWGVVASGGQIRLRGILPQGKHTSATPLASRSTTHANQPHLPL